MTKSLYPTTLFHFTKELETLISILDSQHFKINFAREFIQGQSSNRDIGIPMVSFCDIRLTQLTQHTDNYGHYGIGLSKAWADKNKLNPVIYMSKNAPVFDYYNNELRVLADERFKLKKRIDSEKITSYTKDILNKKYEKLDIQYKKLVDPLRYMKNYQGTLKRRDAPDRKDYIFADEREWRYIPDFMESRGKLIIASKNMMSEAEGKEKCNEYYNDVHLNFSAEDIRYIIVKNETDLPILLDFLSNKIGEKSTLITRVLSTELIGNDM